MSRKKVFGKVMAVEVRPSLYRFLNNILATGVDMLNVTKL